MSTFIRTTVCKAIVGYDQDGRAVESCGKPRCEEAGRRSLCLEHWQASERERAQRQKQLVWRSTFYTDAAEWWANASRIVGGDYHIGQLRDGRFEIRYRAKARRGGSGRWRLIEQTGDTLERAQAIAQADHDAQLKQQ